MTIEEAKQLLRVNEDKIYEIIQIVQDDIALYFSLHQDKTIDLFIHCEIMKRELLKQYLSEL